MNLPVLNVSEQKNADNMDFSVSTKVLFRFRFRFDPDPGIHTKNMPFLSGKLFHAPCKLFPMAGDVVFNK